MGNGIPATPHKRNRVGALPWGRRLRAENNSHATGGMNQKTFLHKDGRNPKKILGKKPKNWGGGRAQENVQRQTAGRRWCKRKQQVSRWEWKGEIDVKRGHLRQYYGQNNQP